VYLITAFLGREDLPERDLRALRDAGDLAAAWSRRAGELAAAVEEAGWDGEWYRRAYDDDGRPRGSRESDECRIDSIAQSWAVLSGAAGEDHARRALASAERELVRAADRVACLLWPPFDETSRDPGYIKAYPPGIRENGGQYTHAAAWLAWAFAAAGDGERAARLLDIISPIEHTRTSDDVARYRIEPYVVAADVASVTPHVGRGGWTWYTGSAAWTYRAAVEALLGLRLAGGRLRIDPCLPPAWPGYRATLRTAAGTLEIEVDNSEGAGRGVAEIRVDGRPLEGDTVDLPAGGEPRHVRVRLRRLSLPDARSA
jgi:cyclic beta-1,2-glucan synthetase